MSPYSHDHNRHTIVLLSHGGFVGARLVRGRRARALCGLRPAAVARRLRRREFFERIRRQLRKLGEHRRRRRRRRRRTGCPSEHRARSPRRQRNRPSYAAPLDVDRERSGWRGAGLRRVPRPGGRHARRPLSQQRRHNRVRRASIDRRPIRLRARWQRRGHPPRPGQRLPVEGLRPRRRPRDLLGLARVHHRR
jgi:hypothetical protein